MQYHGRLALLWHDVIVERALDTLTLTSRPQAVQRKAAVVDPQSVITAIDHFCKQRMGHEYGRGERLHSGLCGQ
ncbi:unnamed protein product [Oncorhynchus mykiss]|uniref:Uncharacterized protein n=1 Tax=Oncorhynchus mykiss TaxID=8022 RepID=A0A060XKB3_ONCMY|nr:unnamed protein product [Oncorhynchus mykiss]